MRISFRALAGVFVLSFLLSTLANAQVDTDTGFVAFKATKFPFKTNTLKIGVLPLLVGEIPYCGELRITYEHPIAHNMSLLVGASYNYPGAILLMAQVSSGGSSGINQLSWRGGRVMVGYRWYPLKKNDAPKGFYCGPWFSYNFLKVQDKKNHDYYETMNYLNVSVVVGYQVISHNGFTFDIFGGIGYKNNVISKDTGIGLSIPYFPFPGIGNALDHVKLTAQVNFGYSF